MVVGVVLAYVELRDPVVTHLDADSHERLAVGACSSTQLARRAEGGSGLYGHMWSLSVEEQFI